MYHIGLTGNIASGKTTAAKLFKEKGIDIISADQIARSLTQPDQPALTEIINHFGKSIINNNGELKRAKLRSIIFNNTKERVWLEKLLHPLIRKKIKASLNECQSPYCIIEIPLIPNKKDYPYLNHILFVQADREQQITRIMQRDNCSKEEAQTILDNQASVEQYKKVADEILLNDGTLDNLKEKVGALHVKYLTSPLVRNGME